MPRTTVLIHRKLLMELETQWNQCISPIYYTLMISEGSGSDFTNSCERQEYISVHKIKMKLRARLHLFCLRGRNPLKIDGIYLCFQR